MTPQALIGSNLMRFARLETSAIRQGWRTGTKNTVFEWLVLSSI